MLGRSDGVDEERAVKKILIVLTNTAAYGERNVATGLWLGEAAEFMDEAIQRGYAVDFVSPKGGYVPWHRRAAVREGRFQIPDRGKEHHGFYRDGGAPQR